MLKPKSTHGGARKGAGRPKSEDVGLEKKKTVTIRLYESQEQRLIKLFGSIQKAIDTL